MSYVQTLVDVLTAYQALPHHSDQTLANTLNAVQTWQKARIKKANAPLFDNAKTAPLAHYLIDRIYGDDDFDVLASQLLVVGQNALSGSGRLEKLIPTNALATGVMGVKSAVTAIQLDLALAQTIVQHDSFLTQFHGTGITDELMIAVYQTANAKNERIAQIHDIKAVCEQSDKYFNSFLIQKAFALAKSTAYAHGYQPLYDFIGDGLIAMKALKKVSDFTEPFVATELAIIHNIHHQGKIHDFSTL